MTTYRNIPMTDIIEAVSEDRGGEPGWALTLSDRSTRWVAERIFKGSIHKDVKLADCEVT